MRIPIAFEGAGAAVAELAWGQREIWSAMVRQNSWLPIGYALELEPGTTVEDVADRVRFWVNRYPSMRTKLRHDPDGHTRQVVSAAGEIPLEVVDAGDGEDPDEVAEEVQRRFREAGYDFVEDWPVRVATVRQRGAPSRLVIVMCHLVLDAFGGLVMLRELAAHRSGEALPPTAMPPVEQARWQASPAGQRQCAAALRHWEGILRDIPSRRFPGSTDRRRPRHWEGLFNSPAGHLALRVIAARTRVDVSPLLLAIFAVALFRLTGVNPVVVQPVVGNRFRPGLADTVSPVNQGGLCALDVAGRTVDEAIALTARRVLAAYKNAYYDPSEVDALVERLGRERGEEIDLSCYFNDRRVTLREAADSPLPTADEVRAALPRSTFGWGRIQDDPWESLFVNVEDVPDAMSLTINADTHVLSPPDIEALARGMEAVAVEAALDPGAKA